MDLSHEHEEFVRYYNEHHSNEKEVIKYDEALMTFISNVTFDLKIYTHNEECWKVSLHLTFSFLMIVFYVRNFTFEVQKHSSCTAF